MKSMTASSAVFLRPLPLAGEGWGEGGDEVTRCCTTLTRHAARVGLSRQRERRAG